MGRAAALVNAILRELFTREELPPDLPGPSGPAGAAVPGRPRARWRLLAPEPLPPDLPPLASTAGDGRSALGRLLGPDPLPEDPPSPRRRHGRWLAWLFAPERLEP